MIAQPCPFNDALDFPRGDASILGVRSPVELEQLHLAVAEVLRAEVNDVFVLARRVFPRSSAVRSSGFLLEAAEEMLFKAIRPFVKCFAGDTEVPGGKRCVLAILFPENNPFE